MIHKMYQVVSKAKEKRSMILNRKINLKSTEEGVEFNPSAVSDLIIEGYFRSMIAGSWSFCFQGQPHIK